MNKHPRVLYSYTIEYICPTLPGLSGNCSQPISPFTLDRSCAEVGPVPPAGRQITYASAWLLEPSAKPSEAHDPAPPSQKFAKPMKILKLFPALGLLLCSFAPLRSQPPAVPGYHLVFSDDFKHLDLSPDRHGAHTWYEGVWFEHIRSPLSNIKTIPDGVRLTWQRGQPGQDTSISTFSQYGSLTHAWRYGYYEVRMRWNPVRGAWPAAWLIPAVSDHQRETGEVDIFEGEGDKPHIFAGTIHHWRESPQNPDRMVDVENNNRTNRFPIPSNVDVSQFHTYALLWEPDKMTWFFDDKPLHTERSFDVFGLHQYALVLTMQAGADWHIGNFNGVTAQQMDLDIQWVRVWQK